MEWWWRSLWSLNRVGGSWEGKECACKVLKETAHEGNARERLLGTWSGRLNAEHVAGCKCVSSFNLRLLCKNPKLLAFFCFF